MKRRNKCNFCKYLFIGIKGIALSIISWLILLLPMWIVTRIFIINQKYVFGGIILILIITFYVYIWGRLGNSLWKWN